MPTQFENNYLLTAEELRGVLGPKSRVLVLCSPGNPTGSVYSKAQLEVRKLSCVASTAMMRIAPRLDVCFASVVGD